jgi:FMN phosphatase YigB (HAD superfamily)
LLNATSDRWRQLRPFCRALGFGAQLDDVVASAEVSVAKPDARIFAKARHGYRFLPSGFSTS